MNISGTMSSPDISVILPAYNASTFLQQAIDSVLNQTYEHFELIIINDGSTDNTGEIIRTYHDPRILLIDHHENKGLIYSLNEGISLAKGKYIARMDADDRCLPERLLLQKQFLDMHPEVSITAGWINFMNEEGIITGSWPLDRVTNTSRSIKRTLLRENCIAHPTVMGRKEIFLQYPYLPAEKNFEDYGLWLRIVADGHRIEKLQAIVLEYRIHGASVTASHLQYSNFFFRHAGVKRRLLFGRVKKGKFKPYDLLILLSMVKDMVGGAGKAAKKAFKK